MNKKLSWPLRLSVVSLIGLILMTNVWLHHYLFGEDVPYWANRIIDICTLGLLIGFISEAAIKVWDWWKKR